MQAKAVEVTPFAGGYEIEFNLPARLGYGLFCFPKPFYAIGPHVAIQICLANQADI